jgi:hypothetical protein
MAETIGKVTNIKLATVTPGFPNAIDVGAFTLLETATGIPWFFYLWVSHAADPAIDRVLQSQRVALLREAAFRKLTVHALHDPASDSVFEITVDIP